ncbi:sensor histidine kinase [Saccharomonospora viridis]|jgi:two-component system sensor histidine kinase MprB|uniref:sensor histidine kinase n=1 Tax=Saccharomonospora viridis TaxID=1852 RepID=UPI0005645BF6|nr:HAMP domain-containing sensor histidine kinase [Saccharomonospora viridis]SFP93177.1 two-component system, OmpR family, sensor histidine kinase MprB [Saccharomonospora viridis]
MSQPQVPPTGSGDSGPRRRFSLRARVSLLAAFCVACAVALVSFGAYITVHRNLYAALDENLINRAEAAVQSPAVQTRLQSIPGAFLVSSDIHIGLLTANGEMIFPRAGTPPPWGKRELAVATGIDESSLRTDSATDMRVIALPAGHGVAMVLAQSLQPTKQTLNELALVLFFFGGAGILVAAAAGTAVARAGLRPVEKLTWATERVTRTMDLRPIPVSGDDELARLTQSFNTMLRAVAESQDRQRRLVADAGHELRTPLTSLRTNLELLLAASKEGAPTLSERDRADIEADIRAQLDEVTQLIDDLSELSREDTARDTAERVDLVDVVERALERARRRAGSIEFDTELHPWVLVGDPHSLERAVLNLLDNAVKFSPQDSVVRVVLRPLGDGTAVIEVSDSGPGIAPEDLPMVFDRFYRSSEARTLPGSGLGLAIVKQAAERHGGTVYANNKPEGGALMAIRLPGIPGMTDDDTA